MGTRLRGARTAFLFLTIVLSVSINGCYTRERRWWSNKRRSRVAQSAESVRGVYSLSTAPGARQAGKSRGAMLVEALRRRSVWM